MPRLKRLFLATILFGLLCNAATESPVITSARHLYLSIYGRYCGLSSFEICVKVNSVNFEDACHFVELAVGDTTGDVNLFFMPSDKFGIPLPGDIIRAAGQVTIGAGNKRHAYVSSIAVLRHEAPPDPQQTTIARMLRGDIDFKPVRVQGIVRDALRSALNGNWIILGVIGERCTVAVPTFALPNEQEALFRLVGHAVTIEGFCSPADPGPLQNGRQIRICDPRAISLCRELDGERPLPPIDELENIHPNIIATLDLHSVSGTVVTAWQNRHALIQEPNGRFVRVDFLDSKTPAIGSTISAVGFPESNFLHINLISATATTVRPGNLPPDRPTDVTISDFQWNASGNWYPEHDRHGQLLRVKGRILTLPQPENHWQMLIEDKGNSLPIEAKALMPALRDVSPGCSVEIVGTCIIEATAWHSIAPRYVNITLVPRFASDVTILSRPPWWTSARLIAVIGTLAAALFTILLWNALLRRAALRKGRELAREQLKHLKAETKTIERTRLAVELHDTLAQNLTGVSLEITAAEQCGCTNTKGLLQHLSIAARALDSCRRSLRDSLWDLRNRALEERDMNAAIRKTLTPHVKGIELVVRFNVQRSRISEKVTHDILCIIRELALNGIRHGGATTIAIAGCLDNGNISFSVRDNGCGFNPDKSPGVAEGHFGMEGIRERLSALSGSIAYESIPGEGTKAKVEIRPTNNTDEEE